MATYVILSTLSPDAFKNPNELKQLAATVEERINAEFPAVTWTDSRHASTETLQGTPWKEFIAAL